MITKKRELNTQLTDDIFSQNFDHLKCLHQTTHKVFLNIFLIYLPFVSFSTVIVSKSGKGRPPAARRSTVDDKSTLMTCIENGKFTKAAKISPGEQSNACPFSQQRVLSNKCAWNGTTRFDCSVCLLETFTKLIEKSLSVNLLIDFNYFSVKSLYLLFHLCGPKSSDVCQSLLNDNLGLGFYRTSSSSQLAILMGFYLTGSQTGVQRPLRSSETQTCMFKPWSKW